MKKKKTDGQAAQSGFNRCIYVVSRVTQTGRSKETLSYRDKIPLQPSRHGLFKASERAIYLKKAPITKRRLEPRNLM
jgi:hypothetical protein